MNVRVSTVELQVNGERSGERKKVRGEKYDEKLTMLSLECAEFHGGKGRETRKKERLSPPRCRRIYHNYASRLQLGCEYSPKITALRSLRCSPTPSCLSTLLYHQFSSALRRCSSSSHADLVPTSLLGPAQVQGPPLAPRPAHHH